MIRERETENAVQEKEKERASNIDKVRMMKKNKVNITRKSEKKIKKNITTQKTNEREIEKEGKRKCHRNRKIAQSE